MYAPKKRIYAQIYLWLKHTNNTGTHSPDEPEEYWRESESEECRSIKNSQNCDSRNEENAGKRVPRQSQPHSVVPVKT